MAKTKTKLAPPKESITEEVSDSVIPFVVRSDDGEYAQVEFTNPYIDKTNNFENVTKSIRMPFTSEGKRIIIPNINHLKMTVLHETALAQRKQLKNMYTHFGLK
jgi:hypothetical protein